MKDIEEKQRKLQEILYRAEFYKQQIQSLEERVFVLEANMREIETAIDTMKYIESTEDGNEILVPAGGNCFIRSSLMSKSEVITSIGANVFVNKNIGDAKKLLNERADELNEAMNQTRHESAAFESRIMELNEQGSDIAREIQQMQGSMDLPKIGVRGLN